MYRTKTFRIRPTSELLAEIDAAADAYAGVVDTVFVADGDALILPTETWLALLERLRARFRPLRRVSCYSTAMNLLEKSSEELRALREAGLSLLYIGPESGDETTMRTIAKSPARPAGAPSIREAHIAAAQRAHAAEMQISAIFLLGAGGRDRSEAHAIASGTLATKMDPQFLSALTLTIVPGTPIARRAEKGKFALPEVEGLLRELRLFVEHAAPTDALFRTNHASNYLPIGGRLPRDRDRILAVLDEALAGRIALRPEWRRGL